MANVPTNITYNQNAANNLSNLLLELIRGGNEKDTAMSKYQEEYAQLQMDKLKLERNTTTFQGIIDGYDFMDFDGEEVNKTIRYNADKNVFIDDSGEVVDAPRALIPAEQQRLAVLDQLEEAKWTDLGEDTQSGQQFNTMISGFKRNISNFGDVSETRNKKNQVIKRIKAKYDDANDFSEVSKYSMEEHVSDMAELQNATEWLSTYNPYTQWTAIGGKEGISLLNKQMQKDGTKIEGVLDNLMSFKSLDEGFTDENWQNIMAGGNEKKRFLEHRDYMNQVETTQNSSMLTVAYNNSVKAQNTLINDYLKTKARKIELDNIILDERQKEETGVIDESIIQQAEMELITVTGRIADWQDSGTNGSLSSHLTMLEERVASVKEKQQKLGLNLEYPERFTPEAQDVFNKYVSIKGKEGELSGRKKEKKTHQPDSLSATEGDGTKVKERNIKQELEAHEKVKPVEPKYTREEYTYKDLQYGTKRTNSDGETYKKVRGKYDKDLDIWKKKEQMLMDYGKNRDKFIATYLSLLTPEGQKKVHFKNTIKTIKRDYPDDWEQWVGEAKKQHQAKLTQAQNELNNFIEK